MHHTIQHLERPTMKPQITCQRAREKKKHFPNDYGCTHTSFTTKRGAHLLRVQCLHTDTLHQGSCTHHTHTNSDEKLHPHCRFLGMQGKLTHTGPWNGGTHQGQTHAAFFPHSNRTENATPPPYLSTMAPTRSLRIHGTLG